MSVLKRSFACNDLKSFEDDAKKKPKSEEIIKKCVHKAQQLQSLAFELQQKLQMFGDEVSDFHELFGHYEWETDWNMLESFWNIDCVLHKANTVLIDIKNVFDDDV